MSKETKATKKHNIRLLSHPSIIESGVYDAVFEVNGEVVEREFEVDVNVTCGYEGDTNYYELIDITVTATCCNEDDEDVANIMECKLEEEIESYMQG